MRLVDLHKRGEGSGTYSSKSYTNKLDLSQSNQQLVLDHE